MGSFRTLSIAAGIPAMMSLGILGCGIQDTGGEAASRTLPEVLSARVIGTDSILVEFSEPAGADASDPNAYHVLDDQSRRLSVHKVNMGDAQTEATLVTDEVNQESQYTLLALEQQVTVAQMALPRVVGAVSTGNTSVIVTFTNRMNDNAENADAYFIFQEVENPEAGILHVTDAELILPDRNAVRLTTLPQNETTYSLHVVNVKDVFGQPLAPPEILVDPSRATFRGTPTSCKFTCSNSGLSCSSDDDCDDDAPCDDGETDCEGTCICSNQDSDGDGLPDHVEQHGWLVTVELTNRDGVFDRRATQDRDVTSDPLNADTDGDGLDDFTERELATDPRNADTDGDGLSDEREFNLHFSNPVDQDTDEDQLDDYLEVTFYKTSPILEDTDGDGLNDDVEVLELNRNPRLADLPEWEIDIGDMLLQIDERYTYVDENGQTVTEVTSTSSSFSEEDEISQLKYNSKVTNFSWEVGGKFGAEVGTSGSKAYYEVAGGISGSSDTMSGSDTTTTSAMQAAYESSLDRGREFTTTREVTREVFGASIDSPLTVRSTGDIAFTISNLEMSVLQLGADRVSFVPIGTLVPNAELATGEATTLNMGPLIDEKGPINLGTQEVFPSLVEDLMRAPRGPIIVPSNFDITDEFGRNFAFTSQEVNDRTATIVIDLGDGRTEQYSVAIAGSIDNKDYIDGQGFVGGFDGDGLPNGIPLDYALQDIIGLTKEPDVPVFDSIIAGDNGVVETVAAGDDVQVFNTATTGLSDISVIIEAGANGVLDTTFLNGDDEFAVTQGYATSATCNEFTVQRIEEPADGEGDGMVNTVPEGDDVYAAGITGVGDAVNPGDVIIEAGHNGIIDTVTAGDDVTRGPGDVCSEDSECLESGSICTGGANDGVSCSTDADCQLEAPACELLVSSCSHLPIVTCHSDAGCDFGSCVTVGQCLLTGESCTEDSECSKGPCIANSFCGDRVQLSCSTDADCSGTCEPHLFCNSNSTNQGEACSTDADCTPFEPGTCEDIDDGTAACSGREVLTRYKDASTGVRNRAWLVYSDEEIPFGTGFGDIILKPRMTVLLGFEQDIDRDGLFARHEYGFGSSDRDKDTDDDGISDAAEVRDGWVVDIAGIASYRVFPDPRTADSDGDGVSDDQERTCGTDPRKRDTDNDGIGDLAELNDDAGGFAGQCLNAAQNPPTHLDPLNPDTDGDGLTDGIEKELGSNNLNPDDAGEFLDSDADGLPDSIEQTGAGWFVTVTACDNTCATAFDGTCQEGRCESDSALACAGTDIACADDSECNIGPCESIGVCSSPAPVGTTCTTDDDCPNNAVCSGGLRCSGFPAAGCSDDGDCVRNCATTIGQCDENSFNTGDFCIDHADCNQLCESGTDCADCNPSISVTRDYSDPTLGDTDFDGLPDLLEQIIGADPNDIDTDGDGLLDFDEFSNFGQYFQNNFFYDGFFLTDAGSQQIGTDPTSQDTDGDTLSDTFERLNGWRVLDLTGGDPPRDVYSSPLHADSDFDGLTDVEEYLGADGIPPGSPGDSGDSTDPTDPDTDGDGTNDTQELANDTNPLVVETEITVQVAIRDLGLEDGPHWFFNLWRELPREGQESVTNANSFINCGAPYTDPTCGDNLSVFGYQTGNNENEAFSVVDFANVCGGQRQFSLNPGDVLVLRLRVLGRECNSVNCVSQLVRMYDYDALASNNLIRETLDVSESGPINNTPCGGQVTIEISRQ